VEMTVTTFIIYKKVVNWELLWSTLIKQNNVVSSKTNRIGDNIEYNI
jgi:hypothetical protein